MQNDAAEAFTDVAVDQQHQWRLFPQRPWQGGANSLRDGVQAFVRGVAPPREREGDRAFAFLEVGAGKRRAYRQADSLGSDLALQAEVASQHRQVLQRQLAGVGDQDGIAADLHRELRRADHGRADTLARVPDRRQVAPMRQHMAQLLR